MTTPTDKASPGPRAGGAAMTLDRDKTLVYLRMNRAACARIGQVLSQAAASTGDALQSGSEEAEELTAYLNASLGGTELAFGEVALDESVPDAPPPSPLTRVGMLKIVAGVVVVVFMLVALFRGLAALVGDGRAMLKGLL